MDAAVKLSQRDCFLDRGTFMQLLSPAAQVLGSSLFFFIVLIFINVHHYFLDNVMWRRGNPEVAKYLFR